MSEQPGAVGEPLDLLAVMAHPDDAELLCGGALITSARAGERVGVLDLTRGEMGTAGSPELRAEEAARSSEIMGLTVRSCADLPDARLENDAASRRVVVEHLRQLRPRIVVTHWKVGRHRDHRICSELVRDACFLTGLKKLEADGDPFRPDSLVYATGFREDVEPASFLVDVTDAMDAKLEAIAAFRSQFHGATQAGEVFPGGERGLMEQIRAKMAHYGSLIRTAYAEPYRIDHALRLDRLTSLDVASF